MDKKYTWITPLLEEDASPESIIYEAMRAIGIGEYTREFISQLVYFAKENDLEERNVPLAILNDAFDEVKERFTRQK